MESDQWINSAILGGVIVMLLFLFVSVLRAARSEIKASGARERKGERLFESKSDIPKLPRNETLYQIIKNSSLGVNKIAFDLNYVFDELALLLRSDLSGEETTVLFDIEADVPKQLIGSPKRLSRVLINLIENAVTYSDGGVAEMRVETVKRSGSECMLRFSIRDEGHGMCSEEIDALRIDPMLREKAGKIPYGFYVADALVHAEEGTLRIASEPERGTTVAFDMTFKLPRKQRTQPQRQPSEACGDLEIVAVVRHARTAEILKRHLEPYVAEVEALVTETAPGDTGAVEGYGMVLIEQRLADRQLVQAVKSRGGVLVVLQSVFASGVWEGHTAADYQLMLPFTHEHLLEMLVIFYGEQSAPSPEAEAAPQRFDSFVSDAEIPVTAGISKKDFARFAGARLLIVEDNPINQRVISGLLGDSGMLLTFAENGLEALDIVSAEPPFDLVLMDINMPELDGIETTRRMRADAAFEAMPIVAFTGLNLKEQIARMREAGMNAHMAKPLNIGRIYSIFDHFLAKADMGASA